MSPSTFAHDPPPPGPHPTISPGHRVAVDFLTFNVSWKHLYVSLQDKVNISVAILAMSRDFGWSPTVSGIVLSSFFAGYMFTQIPGGYLVSRLGGRRVLPAGVSMWSLATAATPILAGTLPGWPLMSHVSHLESWASDVFDSQSNGADCSAMFLYLCEPLWYAHLFADASGPPHPMECSSAAREVF